MLILAPLSIALDFFKDSSLQFLFAFILEVGALEFGIVQNQ
jgi:hypothetical protein